VKLCARRRIRIGAAGERSEDNDGGGALNLIGIASMAMASEQLRT
jgi:hypothetical protein